MMFRWINNSQEYKSFEIYVVTVKTSMTGKKKMNKLSDFALF